jgi:hypothetical protein
MIMSVYSDELAQEIIKSIQTSTRCYNPVLYREFTIVLSKWIERARQWCTYFELHENSIEIGSDSLKQKADRVNPQIASHLSETEKTLAIKSDFFASVSYLFVEGPELMNKVQLYDAIKSEWEKYSRKIIFTEV